MYNIIIYNAIIFHYTLTTKHTNTKYARIPELWGTLELAGLLMPIANILTLLRASDSKHANGYIACF